MRPRDDLPLPDVMFVPFAAAPDEVWREVGSVADIDPGVLSRRFPDFVHQVLNQGEAGPTAMLELQTDLEDGPVRWLRFANTPDRDDLFDLVPLGLAVRAVVAGSLAPTEKGLRVEFCVHRSNPGDSWESQSLTATLGLQDPVPGLMQMVRHLARALEVPFVPPSPDLLTRSGKAFQYFLAGLDNAVLLGGDLDIAVPEHRESLVRPFAEALSLDPSFGLALRLANATARLAVDGGRLDGQAARRFLDRCFLAQPWDGEGCVAIAEQLAGMGDEQRARQWLEHAVKLASPPARGLESLGILKAREGDLSAARLLWEQGLAVDGHPDFFSHLAQLCLNEGRDDEAFEHFVRGLWRLRERTLRAAEWAEQDRGGSVLLECLHAAVTSRQVPPNVVEALDSLHGLFEAERSIDLGLCLFAVGRRTAARDALSRGLRAPTLDLEARDRAVRTLLNIEVPDFELRFARVSEDVAKARDPRPALEELAGWYELQEEFWPALYFGGLARSRLRDADGAMELLCEALELSPGQPDVLFELAELFAARQNCKRALELVDDALQARPHESRLREARLRYLQRLGRHEEAEAWLETLSAQGMDRAELKRLAKVLRRGR